MRETCRIRRAKGVGPINALVMLALLSCACTPREPEIRNVVLVSIDTLGAKHVSAYGYERDTTPNFDRLASEGTLFEHAYTPQFWTMTAHLSMMTGLYPLAHGAAQRRRVSPGATALPTLLRDAGFTTAAFMGTSGFAGPGYGLNKGFDRFETGTITAELDNEAIFTWLEEQAEQGRATPDHRFFLLTHYYDVHSDFLQKVPYSAPEPFQLRYLPEGLRWHRTGATALLQKLEERGASAKDRYVINALHDGGVRYTDEKGLGALLDKLAALDLLDETLLIVTSDHGEEIFEHGAALHQQPYEETARIPLVMRGPRVPGGRRVPDLVELGDLMPTILSLLKLPIPAHVQGEDLTPLFSEAGSLARKQAHVDGMLGAVPPFLDHKQSALIREIDGVRWTYVNTVQPRDSEQGRVFETHSPGELYRLDRDPDQMNDVAAEYPEMALDLEGALLAWYAENEKLGRELGRQEATKSILTKKQRDLLRALGYAE